MNFISSTFSSILNFVNTLKLLKFKDVLYLLLTKYVVGVDQQNILNIINVPQSLKYTLTYSHNGKNYKIQLNKVKKRNKNKVFFVEDENGVDVTSQFNEWQGPFFDFHSHQIQPIHMGYTFLKIHTTSMDTLTFDTNDIIIIN